MKKFVLGLEREEIKNCHKLEEETRAKQRKVDFWGKRHRGSKNSYNGPFLFLFYLFFVSIY